MDLDISQILEIINTTAFPIAVCVILLWIVNGTLKSMRDCLSEVKQSIENNTKVIEVIDRKLSAEEKPHE